MSRLIGQQIELRALEPEDLSILYQWENNESIWQLGQTLKPFSKNTLSEYLAVANLDIHTAKQLRLVIELRQTHHPIGFIDLYDYDPHHQRAGVGILIAESQWKEKGLGKDALYTLCSYAFGTLLLNQLFCSIQADNTASISLFDSLGFKQTGTRIQWTRTDQGYQDEHFYQLFKSAFADRVS